MRPPGKGRTGRLACVMSGCTWQRGRPTWGRPAGHKVRYAGRGVR
jgi:hypothetical protein